MKKIILDSNFLLLPEKMNLDLIREIRFLAGKCEIYTLSACINELKAKKLNFEIPKELRIIKAKNGKADELLLEFGKKGYVIATNDRKLRKKLKENGVQTIFLRQGRYLEME